VAWREELTEQKDGTKKPTKVPYSPSGGKARIPTDPSTYGARKEAESRWRKLQNGDGSTKGGVGIVLGDLDAHHTLMGIDLDDCITKKGNVLAWADEIVDRFNTYVEVSPSSRGVKLFFLVSAKDKDTVDELLGGKTRRKFSPTKDDHREIAIDRARYYAVTDDHLERTPKTFRVIDLD
jgi:hypothetical protein